MTGLDYFTLPRGCITATEAYLAECEALDESEYWCQHNKTTLQSIARYRNYAEQALERTQTAEEFWWEYDVLRGEEPRVKLQQEVI